MNVKHIAATALCAAALSLITLSPARADQALLIGVNQYPGLAEGSLEGCVNDAQAMADALKKYGFDVTLILNEKATRQAIMDGFAAAKAKNKPGERFVFFFAGHGTRLSGGGGALLPHDAKDGEEGTFLPADQVNQAIRAIPAKSRTALLDSCFSGGMMRSFTGLKARRPKLKSRAYISRKRRGGAARGGAARGGTARGGTSQTKDLVLVNRRDANEHLSGPISSGGSGVCYFVASRENQQAGEDEFEGKRHGVFTHFLLNRLNGEKDAWGAIQTLVSTKVAEHMDDTQHPTLTPTFVETAVFEGPNTPTPDPDPEPASPSLWDLYNQDHADPTKIAVTMTPNKTTLKVGEQISFAIQARAPGYLVILERGVSGNVNLLFPTGRTADAARVEAGRTIRIPDSGKAFEADAPGNERIKAILFSSPDQVAALLSKMPASRSIPWRKTRDLKIVDEKKADDAKADDPKPEDEKPTFYTSDITFEVEP